jgi:serine/threonine protein kinase
MLNPGDILDPNGSPLRVLRQLGKGGMGAAFLVEDPVSGNEFVAKSPDTPDRKKMDILKTEYRCLKKLENEQTPNVVRPIRLIDFQWPNGTKFPVLIMEKAEGISLEDAWKGGQFSYEDASDIMSKLADALVEVHNAGYMHLDIKPANIMIEDPHGRNKITLIDFGIAARKSDKNTHAITEDQLGGLSPFWGAPDQRRNPSCGSDIFGVGAVGFALILGHPKTLLVSDKIPDPPYKLDYELRGNTAPPEAAHLHAVIHRATMPERSDRYATMSDLAEAVAGKEPDENFPCIGWASKKFKLEGDGPWIIGSERPATSHRDILVPETSPGVPIISRQQAKIEKREKGVFQLFDLNSVNGTRVRVTKGSAERWIEVGSKGYPLGSKVQDICFAYSDFPPNYTDSDGNQLQPGPYVTIHFFPPRKKDSTEIN